MSYHVYTTEGYILKGVPNGEADKFYYIFTRDLGLIFANAKSVRKIESKLSPSLQDFSVGTYSFIKGKSQWKITHASTDQNYFEVFRNDKNKMAVCSRIFSILPLCITGEEIHVPLFSAVHKAFTYLQNVKLTTEEIFLFECIVMLRIQFHLGYVVRSPEFNEILNDDTWNSTLFIDADKQKKRMVQEINRALKESHLS